MIVALLLVVPVVMVGCVASTYHYMKGKEGTKRNYQAHNLVMSMYKNRNFESDPDRRYQRQLEINNKIDAYGKGGYLTESELKGDNIRLFKPIEKEEVKVRTVL